jgi:crotonobetainyl-CoA:carnitine CoA-transferase CaiB-like acyl-CoA transferase
VDLRAYLPDARAALRIEVDDLRPHNPGLIYVRGDALGRKGPEAGRPGFDHSVFWARSGIGAAVSGPGATRMARPRPAMGDKTASLSMAFGVASALYKRATTGEGSIVDVSLLGTAVWVSSSDIVYSAHLGRDATAEARTDARHRTADDG